jgi:hypothetical protein
MFTIADERSKGRLVHKQRAEIVCHKLTLAIDFLRPDWTDQVFWVLLGCFLETIE